MPRPQKMKKQHAAVAHAHKKESAHQRKKEHMSPKQNHESVAASKLQTTHVSNNRALRSTSGKGMAKDSEIAAVGILDPFAAFQRQYKTGLPFAPSTLPSYGFWTRNVTRSIEIPWGATAQAGVNITIIPWGRPLYTTFTVLDAAGVGSVPVNGTDQQHPFIIGNFQDLVVAYQGVRIRNLTPVLNQGGETTIGSASYADATTLGFDPIRSSSTTITHANGDPGVICQMSFTGNPADNSVSPLFASDYRFTDASITGIDPQSRCITFRTMGIAAAPQVYELEIVTYYLGVPFSAASQIFAPVRYDVTPGVVNRLLDAAYSKTPMLSVPRNFVKDDGWDTLWTGAKAIIKDIGMGLIGNAAAAIGSAFASLFDPKHRGSGLRRLIQLCPEEAFADLRKLVVESNSCKHALETLDAAPPPPRFTLSELTEIAAFMRSQCPKDYEVVASPASAAPGWKVFSRP